MVRKEKGFLTSAHSRGGLGRSKILQVEMKLMWKSGILVSISAPLGYTKQGAEGLEIVQTRHMDLESVIWLLVKVLTVVLNGFLQLASGHA